jgi:poly-D-alanine transfer protein DltD
MLIKLLKAKNVNASFIIMPINPYYYTNSKELTPLIKTLQTELEINNYPCLNLWNADTATYDIGILKDIMHISKYAWYKVDKFIVETYKLTK